MGLLPPDTGDFRLIDRRVADVLRGMKEHRRFLRGLFAWMGFKQTEVAFHRSRRFAGETKYTLKKMLRLASDGIFSFSDKPVSFILGTGAALAALGALWLLILLFVALAGHGNGLSALAALMVLLCGVILLSLGVLGAYIARTYDETLGRPLYIVSERHGFPEEGEQFDK